MRKRITEKVVRRNITGSLFLLTVCLLPLTGCGQKADGNAEVTKNPTVQTADLESAPENESPGKQEQAAVMLAQMTEAIEQQYPGQTFSDLPAEELTISPQLFGGAYLYSARVSSEGIRYVAGVRKTEENPLEEMSCATGDRVPGFQFSQFHEGRILLMEESGGDQESGLSFLYEALDRGTSGIRFMKDVGDRGATLVPPGDSPFLKVSMVKEGYPVTEFIPLTAEDAKKLENGTAVMQEPGRSGRIALCESREDLPDVWNMTDRPPTKEMEALAVKICGFDTTELSDIQDVTKAVLRLSLYGEAREETLQNKEDLDKLMKLLKEGTYGQSRYDRSYTGYVELTGRDGTSVTVQLASEDGGFMLGNSVTCDLSGEATKELWSLFTMIDGWKRYGNKIRMEMDEPSYTKDSPQLNFTLINNGDKEINYSLSPVIYKKVENSSSLDSSGEVWERIASIAGVCGTNTPMKGERIQLSVPWQDAYELKGPGIYRLEIQVIPEKDIRFEVGASFELR